MGQAHKIHWRKFTRAKAVSACTGRDEGTSAVRPEIVTCQACKAAIAKENA